MAASSPFLVNWMQVAGDASPLDLLVHQVSDHIHAGVNIANPKAKAKARPGWLYIHIKMRIACAAMLINHFCVLFEFPQKE